MADQKRGQRRSAVGVVTRDKMNKTRRVEIQRLVKHARYGKYIRNRTVCYVHDEANESQNGDMVEIMETRPLSKNKNWRLVRVVKKAPQRVTAELLAAARKGESAAKPSEEPKSEEASSEESEEKTDAE